MAKRQPAGMHYLVPGRLNMTCANSRTPAAWWRAAICALLLSALPAGAQLPPDVARFLAVQRWEGTITYESSGPYSDRTTGVAATLDVVIKATFRTDHFDAQALQWTGVFSGSFHINNRSTAELPAGCRMTTTVTKDDHFSAAPFLIGIERAGGAYYAGSPNPPLIDTVNETEVVCPSGTTRFTTPGKVAVVPGLLQHGKLPESGYVLAGEVNATLPGFVPWRVVWNFKPVLSDLELVVEPESYDSWMPQATLDDFAPGNTIRVRARLQNKDGSPLSMKAEKFTVKLNRVSRVPGVAMNFPPPAEANDLADLRFDEDLNPRLKILDFERTEAETERGEHRELTVIVSSYDWGAFGELLVTAELPDKTRLNGHLAGDPSHSPVRLPKRSPQSLIADAWKQSVGAGDLPDDDDSESVPPGDGHAGDGLTLYEEYRGFYQNGVHIHGNVTRKDLFIRDDIGDRTKVGIAVFRAVTGFDVHDDLTPRELGDDRRINFNRKDTPFVTDQHGVIIKFDPAAEYPEAWPPNNPGTPGNTLYIRIPPGAGMPPRPDTVRRGVDYFDKVIAHELLHTVAVWHHGDTDAVNTWQIIFGGNRRYLNTEAQIRDLTQSAWIRARSEQGVDFAAAMQTVLQAAYRRYGLFMEEGPLMPVYIGVKGGQHSGVEECLMRYESAMVYPDQAAPLESFYVAAPEPEIAGSILCDRAAGNSLNAERSPQPRYFNALRGNCIQQLCVNDSKTHAPR
jgi:hypothetical protein